MLEKVKNYVATHKKQLFTMFAFALCFVGMATGTGAFAEGASVTLPTIDASAFDFLLTAISKYATEIVPVGLKIMGLIIGIGFIPRLIYKFI